MGTARRLITGVPGLVVAFVLVHAWLYFIDVYDVPLNAAGDVTLVYQVWIDAWHAGGPLVGLGTASVYPVVALVPMIAAGIAGDAAYLPAWVLLATLLNGVATVLLARRRIDLAWWFVAFELLLGPVATVRIDAIALPVAIAGVLAVHRRPALASVLFAIGAWIKVWPGLLLVALVISSRRVLRVVVAAAAASVVVVLAALAAGGHLDTLFSFVSAQTTRGLQIEAPVTAPWLWAVAAGTPGATIYYDLKLLTFQVTGAGVGSAAAVMTPVLIAGVLLVVALGVVARQRRVAPEEVLALTALGLVSAVIALNKVGSPQYCTWYAAPVLLGMLVAPQHFRFPALFVPLLAVLTQLIYPWYYDQILDAKPLMLLVLDVRNLLEILLFAWTVQRLATVPPEGVAGAVTTGAPGRTDRGLLVDRRDAV